MKILDRMNRIDRIDRIRSDPILSEDLIETKNIASIDIEMRLYFPIQAVPKLICFIRLR